MSSIIFHSTNQRADFAKSLMVRAETGNRKNPFGIMMVDGRISRTSGRGDATRRVPLFYNYRGTIMVTRKRVRPTAAPELHKLLTLPTPESLIAAVKKDAKPKTAKVEMPKSDSKLDKAWSKWSKAKAETPQPKVEPKVVVEAIVVKPTTAKTELQRKRLDSIIRRLDQWEKKQHRAFSAIKKLRQQRAYYERILNAA